jgi:hypothetical protein
VLGLPRYVVARAMCPHAGPKFHWLLQFLLFNPIEFDIKFCRAPKIMKSVPNFSYDFLYHGKHLVPSIHGNLLVLVASLLYV